MTALADAVARVLVADHRNLDALHIELAATLDDLDQQRARAAAAEAKLDESLRAMFRAHTTLPGLVRWLDDLARTSILPIRSQAQMWATTLRCLLDVENDGGGQ